jgi:hypothetical protein
MNEVVDGLLVLAVAGLAAFLWKRSYRRITRRLQEFSDQIRTTASNAAGFRSRKLVRRVMREAERSGKAVPISAVGINPVRVKYFPSGELRLFYRDLPSYKAAAQRGEHHGMGARWGHPPKSLKQRSRNELRQMLSEFQLESAGTPPRRDDA